MKTISFDSETFFSTQYSLKQMLPDEYCADERFDCFLVSVYDGSEAWAGHPKDFNWSMLDGARVVMHNARFDAVVLQEMEKRGLIPKLNIAEIHCTADLSSWYCNCRALAQAVEFVFGEHVSKQARTDAKDKHWCDFNAEQQKVMLDYARGDAVWCWKLWDKLSPGWPQVERDLSQLTRAQGRHGVQIDTDLLEKYLFWSRTALAATKKTLPWVEDGKAPSSSQAIAWHCRRIGIPGPPAKVDDAEGYEAWEAIYAPQYPWVNSVTNYRSLAKLVSTFEHVKARLRDDGVMPFALKYFGAATGRWSGDSLVNMQNPRRESVYVNEQDLMEVDEARLKGDDKSWAKAELNFRHLIIPRPGKRMIVSDLAQIEPRVLAWLAGDEDFLAQVATGMSVYEAHARATMGWTGGVLKDEDKAAYLLAKIRVLGLGYGAGHKKFVKIAKIMAGLDLTEEESKAIVQAYRTANPKVVNLWYRLDDAFKKSHGKDFTMSLPSGRKLTYRKVRREQRLYPDPENPEKMIGKWVWTADMGNKREIYFGSKLAENCTQATARDVFAAHLLALNNTPGVTVLFSCHDEAVVEVDAGITADDVRRVMSVTPEWLAGCPVSAEAKEVKRYCK
jgi:DNA polymerase